MTFESQSQETILIMNFSHLSTPSTIRLLIIMVLILHESDGFTAGIGANVPGRKRSEMKVSLGELQFYKPSLFSE